MTILVYRDRHRQFRRIRRIYTTPPQPSNLVIKRWPNRWLRKRARVQPYVLRRAKIRYPIAGPPAGYIAYKRTPFLRPKIKRWKKFTRKIYSIAGPPAGFIAYRRPPRPKIKRGKRFPRAKGVFLRALLLFAPRKRLKIKRARLRLRPRLYSIAGPPVGFVAYKRPPRPRIKRARRFQRKLFPFLPQLLLLFAKARRFKIKRRVLRAGRKLYSIAGPPAGIATQLPLRPLIPRRSVFFAPQKYPFLPTGPLIWQRPRLLRPKIKRGRKFAIKHPYTTPPTPVSFVAWRPFKRPKVKRPKISLRRFQLRYYEFPGVAPIVSAVVDWLIRARRRGRR